MKLMKKFLGITVVIAVIGFMTLPLTGCPEDGGGSGGGGGAVVPSGLSMAEAIPLTADTWADGNISTAGGEQWFKFTATATTHYIHVSFDTLTDLYVQVYGSNGTEVGTMVSIYNSSTNKYTNRTTTADQEYYIKITPYNSSYIGTYQIAFNTSTTSPAFTLPTENIISLTADTWADGNIPIAGGEQWFKFTATANPNHIHFSPGTLTSVNVNVYNSSGNIVGNQINLTSSTKFSNRATTADQEYYIKVTPYSSSGAYKIAFSASFITFGKTATLLTANTWADGSIASSSDEQWFKFAATANTQYIHIQMTETTTMRLYNSDGSTQGSAGTWYGSIGVIFNFSQETLVNGQTYYFKITCSASHNYKIAFNTSTASPAFTLPTENVIPLTADTWADGNIPTTGGEQWFKFTATASTQYIHVSFGTLTSVNVNVYNSNGNIVGKQINLYSSTTNTDRTTTVSQEYYIKITPYSGSGTYKIAFSASTTPPSSSP
jgi:hypothetical protein